MPRSRRWCWIRCVCSTVRAKRPAAQRSITALLGLLTLGVLRCAAAQFSAEVYDQVRPSVIRISCSNRAGTGFLWSSPDTAVTALHLVSGCGKISAYYEALKVTRPATIVKVLRRADLVLLRIADAPGAHMLEVDTAMPSLTEPLATLGYPLQILSMSSTSLQLRYGGKTLRNIVPETVAQTLSGGSPSLDLEIENIEGHLLPGHSGAPIFNEQRRVVAIADGGLENGAAALSWGIPAHYLNQLASSTENPDAAVGAAGEAHAVLFAAETESKNLGETTCSGATLTKLRSATFAQLVRSVDDPAGLMQSIQMMQIDPSNFLFDVYQHLPSGATFVLPSGAELQQSANGDCRAALPSGRVELHIRLAMLGSAIEVQSVSQSFENTLVDGKARGWVPDAMFTNAVPLTRFDGLLVRRRGYEHVKLFPMYQDKYLFEVLAARNNLFIGSAALQQTTPQWNQKIVACKAMPASPQCGDVRQYAVDWVKALLGIQLTTFPVG